MENLVNTSDGPDVTGTAITCGHCSNRSLMHILARYEETRTEEAINGPHVEVGEEYDLLKCPACFQINLRLIQWDEWTVESISDEGDDPEDVLGTIVYPAPPEIPEGLPPIVRNAYHEALAVRAVSPNAYAVLLGRVLENVCRDRNASGTTLYKQIADLGKKNEIPERIVKLAHGLRKLRNAGAHAAVGSLKANEVTVLERLARAVLEYVYTAPHLVRLAEKEKE